MKVLKEGEKKSWSLELKCTGAGNGDTYGACGATLLVEEDDIFMTKNTDLSGFTDIYYTFECPCCKSWTDIEDRKLPGWIRDKASKNVRYSSDRNRSRSDD